MIIHIGYDACVQSEEIALILDRPGALKNPDTAAAIEQAKRQNRFYPCSEKERAYVLLTDGRIYASALHTVTLHKRIEANGLL